MTVPLMIMQSYLLMKNKFQHRSSPPEVFQEKGVLKICSKFTGEHPCRSVISIKLLCKKYLWVAASESRVRWWVFNSCFLGIKEYIVFFCKNFFTKNHKTR